MSRRMQWAVPLLGCAVLGLLGFSVYKLGWLLVHSVVEAPAAFRAEARVEIAKQYGGEPISARSVPYEANSSTALAAWKVNEKLAQCVASVGATPKNVALACNTPSGE